MPVRRSRRASRWGALFASLRVGFLASLCLFALPSGLLQAASCTHDRFDELVRVRYVYDGDTLILSDDRRVRLIGLDTPELGRDGKPDQPYALAARDALRHLLSAHDNKLRLRYDETRHDRYGRLLAHLFLTDGSSVEQWLLGQGLATVFTVPPNDWHLDCYSEAERVARQAGLGVWSLPRYRVWDSRELPEQARGFYLVRGRVQRIGEGRHNLWLNLPGGVALRIERDDLKYFAGLDVPGLQGREVEARGWLQRQKGEWRMRIRHPAALHVVAADVE